MSSRMIIVQCSLLLASFHLTVRRAFLLQENESIYGETNVGHLPRTHEPFPFDQSFDHVVHRVN